MMPDGLREPGRRSRVSGRLASHFEIRRNQQVAEPKKPKPRKGAKSRPETPLPDGSSSPKTDEAAKQAQVGDATSGENPVEPVADADAEVTAQSVPSSHEPSKRGGFIAALIGGVLAALLVLFAAQTEIFGSILPGASDKSETAELLATLRDNDIKKTEALAALRAEIAALEQPDLRPITAQQAVFQADIALLMANLDAQQAYLRDLEARLTPLATRLEALEMRPMTEDASQEAIAAYDRELAALQSAMAAQRADVEAMIETARATESAARVLEQSAAAKAQNAQNQATFARLLGALENGAAFAPILQELVAAGVVVPPALTAAAAQGITTQAALGDAFPASARAALSTARADASENDGLGGFLQRHLSARSVSPRQGDNPDAILSRAEAAVIAGDLAKALQEIANLPDSARADMQVWTDAATTRLDTLQAADELALRLNTN